MADEHSVIEILAKFIDGVSRPAKNAAESLQQLDKRAGLYGKTAQANTRAHRDQTREVGRFGTAVRGLTRIFDVHHRTMLKNSKVSRFFQKDMYVLRRELSGLSNIVKKDVKPAFERLGKAFKIMKIPAMILGVLAAVPAVFALGGAALTAATALAPLVGLVAAFPAGIGGFMAASFTIKQGLTGIGDAMKVITDPHATLQQIRDAFRNLGPNATKFALAGAQAKRDWQDVQYAVREALTGDLLGPMQKVLSVYMPIAQKAMVGIAHAIGTVARVFAKAFTTPQALSDIGKLLGSNTRNTSIWGQAIVHLLSAFRGIMVSAIPMLNKMSDVALKVATRIDSWASSKKGRKSLGDFFTSTWKLTTGIVKTLGAFGMGLFNIVRIGMGITKPGGIGGGISQMAQDFLKWTQSEEGRKRIHDFFVQIQPLIHDIANIVGVVASGLAQIGTNPSNIKSVEGFLSGLAKLGPTLVSIGNFILGTLVPAIGYLIGKFKDLWNWTGKLPTPLKEIARAGLVLGGLKILGIGGGGESGSGPMGVVKTFTELGAVMTDTVSTTTELVAALGGIGPAAVAGVAVATAAFLGYMALKAHHDAQSPKNSALQGVFTQGSGQFGAASVTDPAGITNNLIQAQATLRSLEENKKKAETTKIGSMTLPFGVNLHNPFSKNNTYNQNESMIADVKGQIATLISMGDEAGKKSSAAMTQGFIGGSGAWAKAAQEEASRGLSTLPGSAFKPGQEMAKKMTAGFQSADPEWQKAMTDFGIRQEFVSKDSRAYGMLVASGLAAGVNAKEDLFSQAMSKLSAKARIRVMVTLDLQRATDQLAQLENRQNSSNDVNSGAAVAANKQYNKAVAASNRLDATNAIGRFAGGPVWPGEKFLTGELRPEVFLGKSGATRLLGAGGPELTSFNESGVVIPSVKAAERVLGPNASSSGAPTLVQNTPHIQVTFTGPVSSNLDVEQAILQASRRMEREQRERGIQHGIR